jgi:hypothetical protein
MGCVTGTPVACRRTGQGELPVAMKNHGYCMLRICVGGAGSCFESGTTDSAGRYGLGIVQNGCGNGGVRVKEQSLVSEPVVSEEVDDGSFVT